nr:hypothetical protein PIFADJLK_00073 [Oryctes rhinoceros nudivirus]WDA64764.1 hypothetical protein NALGGIOA_00072 [Oryctes rhinoceros nudivirus]
MCFLCKSSSINDETVSERKHRRIQQLIVVSLLIIVIVVGASIIRVYQNMEKDPVITPSTMKPVVLRTLPTLPPLVW